MKILGIDPGERTGYAVYESDTDTDLGSGVMYGDDFVQAGQLIRTHKPDVIVCEDQFLGSRLNKNNEKRYFANAFARLKFYVFAWEKIAKHEGVEFAKPINPATWQAYWKLKRGDKTGMCLLASKLLGRDVAQDEADAVLLARAWAAKHQAAMRLSLTDPDTWKGGPRHD